jgi:hypothetical protein
MDRGPRSGGDSRAAYTRVTHANCKHRPARLLLLVRVQASTSRGKNKIAAEMSSTTTGSAGKNPVKAAFRLGNSST